MKKVLNMRNISNLKIAPKGYPTFVAAQNPPNKFSPPWLTSRKCYGYNYYSTTNVQLCNHTRVSIIDHIFALTELEPYVMDAARGI